MGNAKRQKKSAFQEEKLDASDTPASQIQQALKRVHFERLGLRQFSKWVQWQHPSCKG